ncbi:MAG TPA: hypothetical protein V6C81_10545 [Planktothrix sp.]|jgi:hypothetical protein
MRRVFSFVIALLCASEVAPVGAQPAELFHADFRSPKQMNQLLWKWDKELRCFYIADLFNSMDLQGKSRDEMHNILGSPDRIEGVAEAYGFPYGPLSSVTCSLEFQYLCGTVRAWRLGTRFKGGGWMLPWATKPRPVAWYLNGSRAEFPRSINDHHP